MKSAYWPILFVGLSQALLLATVLVDRAESQSPDRAAWQQWVHETISEDTKLYPTKWRPGSTASIVQFGHNYCEQHDRKRRRENGIDNQTAERLREDLVRKGVPVNSADGVAIVNAAADVAQRTMCP